MKIEPIMIISYKPAKEYYSRHCGRRDYEGSSEARLEFGMFDDVERAAEHVAALDGSIEERDSDFKHDFISAKQFPHWASAGKTLSHDTFWQFHAPEDDELQYVEWADLEGIHDEIMSLAREKSDGSAYAAKQAETAKQERLKREEEEKAAAEALAEQARQAAWEKSEYERLRAKFGGELS